MHTINILETMHFKVCEPITMTFVKLNCFLIFLLIISNRNNFLIYLLKIKNNNFLKFKDFKAHIKKQLNIKLRYHIQIIEEN